MSNLTYSAVIPCYNCAQFISRAIESISSQTLAPVEIICVDNNSTDDTMTLLEEIAAKNSLVTVCNESNQGASYARNRGINMAKGDYIQLLDADDYIGESKVETQLSSCTPYGVADLIIDSYRISKGGKICGESVTRSDDLWCEILSSRFGITSSNLWKTNTLKELGGFDTSMKTSEEYELMFRFLKADKKVALSNTYQTIKYNDNEFALTGLTNTENMNRYLNLRTDMYKYLVSTNQINQKRQVAFFDILRVCYAYDTNTVLKLYEEFFDKSFTPDSTLVTSAKYIALYNIFGFKITQWLLSLKS